MMKGAIFLIVGLVVLNIVPVYGALNSEFHMVSKTIIYVDDDSLSPGDGTLVWPYTTIQYAIDNASTGDTITVASGQYNEHVVVNKRLLTINWYGDDILGSDMGEPIIDGNGVGIGVLITESDVHFSEMVIRNCGLTDLDAGIYISDQSEDCTILFCDISDCGFGIWSKRHLPVQTSHEIRGNVVHDIVRQGIIIQLCDGNEIKDNMVYDCDHGIYFHDCNVNTVSDNDLRNNSYGLVLDVGVDNKIESNTCAENSQWGFVEINGEKNNIRDNNFYDNGVGQATWINSIGDRWFHNYWGRPAVFIHFVLGTIRGADIEIPFVKIELQPARTII